VNPEQIVTIGIFIATQVGSLIWVLANTRGEANVLKAQLESVENELRKLSNVLVSLADLRGEIAIMNERHNILSKRLDEEMKRTNDMRDRLQSYKGP
jgi:Tfp pilus assembly protein PilO